MNFGGNKLKCLLCGKEVEKTTDEDLCTKCLTGLGKGTILIFPTEEMIEAGLDRYEKKMLELQERYPQGKDLHLISSLIYIKKGEYKRAEDALSRYEKKAPGDEESPEALLLKAKLRFFMDQQMEAREELLSALERGGIRWTDCLVETINLFQSEGFGEIIKRFLPHIPELKFNFSTECVKVVKLLLKEDLLSEAYFLMEKYRTKFSTSPQFQILYATVAIRLGEYSGALRTLSTYLEKRQDDALAYIYLAKAHTFRGHFMEAVRALKRGYSTDPHLRWSGVILELKEGLTRLINLNYYKGSYGEKLKSRFKAVMSRLINLEDLVRRAPPERYVEHFCATLLELQSITDNTQKNIEEIKRGKDKWFTPDVSAYINENLNLIEKKLSKGLTFDAAHAIERLNTIIEILMNKNSGEVEKHYREKLEVVKLLHKYGVIPDEYYNNFVGVAKRESSQKKYYLFYDRYFQLIDSFERNFGNNFEEFRRNIEKDLNEMERKDFPVGYLKKEIENLKLNYDTEMKIEAALKVRKELEEINRSFWVKEGDYLIKEIEMKLSSLEKLGYDTYNYREELKKLGTIRQSDTPQGYFDRVNELYTELETLLQDEKKRRAIAILSSSEILRILSINADSFAPERYYFRSVLDILEKFIERESYDRVSAIYSQIVKEFLERVTPEEDEETKDIITEVLQNITAELKGMEEKYLIQSRFLTLEARAQNLKRESYTFYMEVLTELTSLLLTYEVTLKEVILRVSERASAIIKTINEICPGVEESHQGSFSGVVMNIRGEHEDVLRLFYNFTVKRLYEKNSYSCLKKHVQEREKRIKALIQETLHITNNPDILIDVQTESARASSLFLKGQLLEAIELYKDVEKKAVEALRGAFEEYRRSLISEFQEIRKELSMVTKPPENFERFVDSHSGPLKKVSVNDVRSFIEMGESIKKEILSMLMMEKAKLTSGIRDYIEKCAEIAEGWENETTLLKTLKEIEKRLEAAEKDMNSLTNLFQEARDLYLKVLYNGKLIKLYEEASALANSLIKEGNLKSSKVESIESIKAVAEDALSRGDVGKVEKAVKTLEEMLKELHLSKNVQTVENIYSKVETLYDLITIQLRDLKSAPWRDFRAEFIKRLEEIERETREDALSLEVDRLYKIDSEISELKKRMQLVVDSWDLYRRLEEIGTKTSSSAANKIKRALLQKDFQDLENLLKNGSSLVAEESRKKAEQKETKREKVVNLKRGGFRGISRLASEAYRKARIIDDVKTEKPAPQGLAALIKASSDSATENALISGGPQEPPGISENGPTDLQFISGHIGEEEFFLKEYRWSILLPGLLDTIRQENTAEVDVCEELINLASEMIKEAKDIPDKGQIEGRLQKASYHLHRGDSLRATYYLKTISKTLYNYTHLARHLKSTLISFSTILDSRREAGIDITNYMGIFMSCVNLYNNGYLLSCGEKIRKLKSAIMRV